MGRRYDEWIAETILGRYVIYCKPGCAQWTLREGHIGYIDATDVDEAKEAIWLDFEGKVRAALVDFDAPTSLEGMNQVQEALLLDFRRGYLTPLGVAQNLVRAGFRQEYAVNLANKLPR